MEDEQRGGIPDILKPVCPQIAPIEPSKHASRFKGLDELISKDDFRKDAYESLGAAVRIP